MFVYFCRRSSSCISRGTWAQRPLWWLRISPGWTGRCGLLLWGRTHRAPGSAASYTDSCRANETVRPRAFTSACIRFKSVWTRCSVIYCVNIPCVLSSDQTHSDRWVSVSVQQTASCIPPSSPLQILVQQAQRGRVSALLFYYYLILFMFFKKEKCWLGN